MRREKSGQNPLAGMMPGQDSAQVADLAQGVLRAQAKVMDAVLRQGIEALDFLKARYEKDRALYAALAEAEDQQAAAAVLADFMQHAFSDYADEAGKLGALAAVTAEQIVEGAAAEMQTAKGAAPAKAKA
jgi:hypothetical protein